MITKEIIEAHGLTDEEYKRITATLGREPTIVELGIFSVMWSEHCSYKSSKIHLKKFPTSGEGIIQGPGENAGAIDIGGGLAVVFKIESHNHPSFIEPYQGAATGVGGILRDIFTMGARPIALLDSLRFGDVNEPLMKYLFSGVVRGISDYGNSVGVPTIGGEIYFNEIYNKNILVNVFALGIAKKDKIFRGRAAGIGNPVIYAGSKTGRDGIHGATMASDVFDEEAEAKRPTVQVGDPFTEKLLLEACLEAMDRDLIVGIQDMGAAGLTSSSCEMAGRAGTGIDIYVERIPLREPNMTPYEIMLSESQERMLIVAKRGKEKELMDIFKKWDLHAVVVGEVTDKGRLRVIDRGEVVADIPVKALTEDAPLYNREGLPPAYIPLIHDLDLELIPIPDNFNSVLQVLLAVPDIASKEWVYEQYDHMVRTNTIVLPGSDAAVIRIKGTSKAIAMSTDCNSAYCFSDPYMGGMIAVAEAARNVVCGGGRPAALTDCLNFGNPEKPEVMWQFREAIEGISDMCKTLNIPVVSGNVSFYNETNDISIYPTPVIGMVGIVEDISHVTTSYFKDEGDVILLLGENKEELGMSLYLKEIHHTIRGYPPQLYPHMEKKIQDLCLKAIQAGVIKSAHDVSEGGLAVAIAECCIPFDESSTGVGALIELQDEDMRPDALLFGETQSRIIISVSPEKVKDIFKMSTDLHVPVKIIGRVEGENLIIKRGSEIFIHMPIREIARIWRRAIPELMEP